MNLFVKQDLINTNQQEVKLTTENRYEVSKRRIDYRRATVKMANNNYNTSFVWNSEPSSGRDVDGHFTVVLRNTEGAGIFVSRDL